MMLRTTHQQICIRARISPLLYRKFTNANRPPSLKSISEKSSLKRFISANYYNERYPKLSKYGVAVVKIARTVFIGFALYNCGRQAGIAEYAADPVAMEKKLTLTLLGSRSPDDLKLVKVKDPAHQRVDKIAQKIVFAARDYVDGKVERRLARLTKLKKRIAEKKDESALSEAAILENELNFWNGRRRMLKGHWTTLLVDVRVPNAFVSDLTPRKIYIMTGLLTTLECNDDELALVLGHEISHLLLGHTSSRVENEKFYRISELVLLSMLDPSGILTFALAYFGYKLSSYRSAAHSRQHEREADDMGLKIAALACYDTQKGSHVFGKLAKLGGSARQQEFHYMDTHPLPLEREQELVTQSATIRRENHSHCSSTYSKFWRAKAHQQENSVLANLTATR